jgi:LuxR family transcriptional regulator, quorum-sensing system regulator BjaR1
MAFVASASDNASKDEISLSYEKMLLQLGFEHYLACLMPKTCIGLEFGDILGSNHSSDMIDDYIKHKKSIDDPVFIAGHAEKVPFYWSHAFEKHGKTEVAQGFIAKMAEHGFSEGLAFSFANGFGRKILVSVTGRHAPRLEPTDVALLHLASIHFSLLLQAKRGEAMLVGLSARERDALNWIANGKTAWEVAQIMAICKSTVDRHLMHVRAKLGANTNAHAAALAIASGDLPDMPPRMLN